MRRAGGGGASGLSSADTASPRAPPRRKQTFKRRCAACVALAALGVAVIVMPRRTVDLKLDAAHLTTRQWLGDAYWAARAAAAEAASVPRHKHYHFNGTAARHACEPQAPELVLHLKVPKAASTTVFDLIGTLAPKNQYRVNNRPQYLDAEHETRSARAYARYFLSLKPRTVRSAHGVYLDFARLLGPGALRRTPPCYVGLVREPTKRLRSHYDYLHWGPRSPWARFWKGQDAGAPPFWDCVERRRQSGNREESRGGCLYWANAQLQYFCGVHRSCREGSEAALRRALAHARSAFAAVGVVEDLTGFLEVLERVLPGYFAGVAGTYARATIHARTTHHVATEVVPPAARDFLRTDVLKWEYALYAAVERDFRRQKQACKLP